ncbi:MAG TPA: tetratricopeptide repeat protein [Armatimonadota bacterium]
MMRIIRAVAVMAGIAVMVAASARAETNPHDGYAFWLPNGKLTVGDKVSEKRYNFRREGNTVTFDVPLRKTRFDTPSGNLYVLTVGPVDAEVTNGVRLWGNLFLIPRAETAAPASLKVTSDAKGALPKAYRFYFSDDMRVWPRLRDPQPLWKSSAETTNYYACGVERLLAGKLPEASEWFIRVLKNRLTTEQARYARHMIRWCDAETRFPKIVKTDAKAYYNLGLYCMVNGFWELAEKSFMASTKANPKNPDAWYMLGDAASYVHSDLDMNFAQVYPYYQKAADLYPRKNSNTFRNHLALFRKLRVSDGKGGTTVITMSDEQIAATKLKWKWCTALFEASSRGSMRMVNNWAEYDREFDNSAPMEHDPAPYEGLFETGTIETFMKFAGWGASDAIGPDCGANRGADVNIGQREWDVLYHEWNHTLDWLMTFSGQGIGVPDTHSSDWCGFEPISSMGMGHHSCNRYYMTPGMYRTIHGSDKPTTPWIDEWLISNPTSLDAGATPTTEKDQNRLRAAVLAVQSPLSPRNVPSVSTTWASTNAVDGYVDLYAIEHGRKAAYSFAHTYVWSPKDQKVRCWYGADDNAKIWVNNQLQYPGQYWSVCKWEETQEKDQICCALGLKRGWNSVLMQVSNVPRFTSNPPPPHPFYYGNPDSWGFSMRLCGFQNEPLEGVKWQAKRPSMFEASLLAHVPTLGEQKNPKPTYYQWAKVKDDYTWLLPHLTTMDLRAITGYSKLNASEEMLFDPGQPTTLKPARLFHNGKADPNEIALNNELNWFFSPKEMVGVLRYKRGAAQARDLVFLRPEMYEAFTSIARVSPEAAKRGIKSHADRVIGYYTVPRGDNLNGRVVLVLDTWLGNNPPVDEEDLLAP